MAGFIHWCSVFKSGGVCSYSGRDKCRLFEYSLSANTWDMFDTHVNDFPLAIYLGLKTGAVRKNGM